MSKYQRWYSQIPELEFVEHPIFSCIMSGRSATPVKFCFCSFISLYVPQKIARSLEIGTASYCLFFEAGKKMYEGILHISLKYLLRVIWRFFQFPDECIRRWYYGNKNYRFFNSAKRLAKTSKSSSFPSFPTVGADGNSGPFPPSSPFFPVSLSFWSSWATPSIGSVC